MNTMNKTVALEICADYDVKRLQKVLLQGLKKIGGVESFIHKGDTVLLKPNFLAPRKIETAVTTHPAFISAVALVAREAGAHTVLVSDSPGIGTVSLVSKAIKLSSYLSEEWFQCVPFTETKTILGQGGLFSSIAIARLVSEVDVVINLPKVKTHGQMILTGAVKNSFGCVVGLEKTQWHLKAGTDFSYFARLLLRVHETVQPHLTIVDGVIGMDGNGPNAGNPRQLGWILFGTDAIAIDTVISELLGINCKLLPVQVAANNLYNNEYIFQKSMISSDTPVYSAYIRDFRLPRQVQVLSPIFSSWFGRLLRKPLTERPRITHEKCILCSECIKHCPPNAMSFIKIHEKTHVEINYDLCIRCFCCQELCPAGAITISSGRLLKFLHKLQH